MKWTAIEDQKILRGIFKFHDIKSSTALLNYLAEEIGGGKSNYSFPFALSCSPQMPIVPIHGLGIYERQPNADNISQTAPPRAVSHRLANIRKSGDPGGRGQAASSPEKPATPNTPASRFKASLKGSGASKSTSKGKPAPKTTTKGKPAAKNTSKDNAVDSPIGLFGGRDEDSVSPLAARGQRMKRVASYSLDESDDDDDEDASPAAKRVKIEDDDEHGQGWFSHKPTPEDAYVDEV
ncbi:hypothetical protein IQ07DRAFT_598972 [Pyrenochaeta sp. DS3sAY3a]|nr:hypothetical protein IQ07DRAFT_598972 [Pyrenochaeta sp. DS3sAY3a]